MRDYTSVGRRVAARGMMSGRNRERVLSCGGRSKPRDAPVGSTRPEESLTCPLQWARAPREEMETKYQRGDLGAALSWDGAGVSKGPWKYLRGQNTGSSRVLRCDFWDGCSSPWAPEEFNQRWRKLSGAFEEEAPGDQWGAYSTEGKDKNQL